MANSVRCADVVLRVHRLADTGALLDVTTLRHAQAVAAQARLLDVEHRLGEVIPATRTVYLQAAAIDLDRLLDRLLDAALDVDPARDSRLVMVPVRYDGADLPEVAERLDMDVQAFVREHQAREYEVAFFGFAPGQAFFGELPPSLRVPRRSVPRTRVPSGALAIANEYTIIYPDSSPGGWNLIGHRAGPALWDPSAEPPNAVEIGDRVRFVDAT